MKTLNFAITAPGWFYKEKLTGALLCVGVVDKFFPGIKKGKASFNCSVKPFTGSTRVGFNASKLALTIKGETHCITDDFDRLHPLFNGARAIYVKLK